MLHRVLARVFPVMLVASLITFGPVVDTNASPEPVPTERRTIPIAGVDRAALEASPVPSDSGSRGDQVVAMTDRIETPEFRVTGVTWQGERADVEAFVRTRDASSGAWSDWSLLEVERGPDPDTAEAASARLGTEPLVAAPSDGIQVRVESPGGEPAGLEVDVIDPGASPADASVDSDPASSAHGVQATPTARTRAEWGADESIRKGEPEYGEVRGAVVHHSAGTNDYSQSDVPKILRGIYSYHVQTRGWNDIGYNVLIDKWGRPWEGRAGGLDKAVVGAHALGVNDETFGISALGDYDTAAPTDTMVGHIERFIAWKLGVHHVDPTASATIGGEWRPTVLGHRDVGQTVCPGRHLYARLAEIREGAKERQSSAFYRPSTAPRSVPYGTGGSALTVGTAGYVTWRVRVSNPCLGVISDRSSARSGDTDLTVTWIGRMAHSSSAQWAPPGTYTVELTGTDTQSGAKIPGWSDTVTITETADSPPPACA